jgi:hypothetical protein
MKQDFRRVAIKNCNWLLRDVNRKVADQGIHQSYARAPKLEFEISPQSLPIARPNTRRRKGARQTEPRSLRSALQRLHGFRAGRGANGARVRLTAMLARTMEFISIVRNICMGLRWDKVSPSCIEPYRPEKHYMRGPGPKSGVRTKSENRGRVD